MCFKVYDCEIYVVFWVLCGVLFVIVGWDKKVKIWRVVDDACEFACEFFKFIVVLMVMVFVFDFDVLFVIVIGFDDGGIEVYVVFVDVVFWTLSFRAFANDRYGVVVRVVVWCFGFFVVFVFVGDDYVVYVYEYE